MKKRKFLIPVTVAIASLSGVANADISEKTTPQVTGVEVDGQLSTALRDVIGDEFVISTNQNETLKTAYHRSHMSHSSHSSHQSHRSHFSGYR